MPELPEVEVVKKSLNRLISNLSIKKIVINTKFLRFFVDAKEMQKIVNSKIISIKRRAKYLLFSLSNNYTILFHLGMTGKFIIIDSKKKRLKTSFYYELSEKNSKHNHLIFEFKKNIKLIYNDVRKFGFVKIKKTSEINKINHLVILGPEPLSKLFNYKYFVNYITNKKKPIKSLLMDQNFVAGLGNIYVNEILFLSGIHPKKFINKLSKKKIKKVILNIKQILRSAIIKGGSSIKNFNDTQGKSGKFQQFFNVYGRDGNRCAKYKCNGMIKKIKQSSRATFYCDICQKL